MATGRSILWAAVLLAFVAGFLAPGQIGAAGASGGSSVRSFGGAALYGAPTPGPLDAPMTAVTATPDGAGYWLLGGDGGVFDYGAAGFFGAALTAEAAGHAVGLAPTRSGDGYWIASDTGLVRAFGDAPQYTQALFPNAPVVGIAATPVGTGYWLAGADGGVFAYGDATFFGSMGGKPLAAPIVGIAATSDGNGYWLVGADGGVFAFGDAAYDGSMGGKPLAAPVVGIAVPPGGGGYWLVGADGGIFAFGGAKFDGSLGGQPPGPTTPVVGMATAPGGGYWLATTDKALPPPPPVPGVVAACDLYDDPPTVEPSSIVLACGDGNASLVGLTWTSWTATAAVGAGTFHINQCTPDCAQGTFADYPATVSLGYPLSTGSGPEFAALTYTTDDPSLGGTRSTSTVLETSPG